jgi:hypothetical protein
MTRTKTQISEKNMGSAVGSSHSSVPNGQIIDFERAELRRVPFQDSLYLWVRGSRPMSGCEIRLAPRIYNGRPDYWGIEVAAIASRRSDNWGFEQSVPLAGITGIRGNKVIGANQIKRIEIDDKSF